MNQDDIKAWLSTPPPETPFNFLTLGGGVQSSAMLAMACLGKHNIPRPDVAIFADTKGEIAATYTWLEKLKVWAEGYGIRVVFTTKGSLEYDTLVGVDNSHSSIPGFIKVEKKADCVCLKSEWVEFVEDGIVDEEYKPTRKPSPGCAFCGGTGEVVEQSRGVMRRFCTWDYKLMALDSEVRRQLGLKKGERAKGVKSVRALIGISFDEIIRVKPSRVEWVENCFPLVDERLTRRDCQKFLLDVFGEVPPRSSCYYCPHHSDSYWRWLRDEHNADFKKAIEFDLKFRESQPGLTGKAFLHGSLKPLSEVEFKGDNDHQLPLFKDGMANECEGMCGV